MPKARVTQDTGLKTERTEKKSGRKAQSTPNKSASSKTVVTKPHELEGQLKRALADYQNLEKRVEEERRILAKLSASLLIKKLLPVLDNLENAQSHLKDQGLEIVIKQFKDILDQEQVEEIAAEGSEFNPSYHEAVETKEGEKDNIVVKVLTKGYKIENTVLRPAKVVVTKKSVDQEAEKKAESTSDFGDYA